MNKKTTWILLVLCLAGAVLSFVLLKQHLTNISTGFEEKSFCNINEVINCDLVDASPYSQIKGIPVSGLSVLFYFILASLVIVSLVKSNPAPLAFGGLLIVLSVLASVYMAYLSFGVLKLACLFCIGLYAINLALLAVFPFSLAKCPKQALHLVCEQFKTRIQSIGFYALISLVVMAWGSYYLVGRVNASEQEWALKKRLSTKTNQLKNDIPVEELVQMFFDQKPIDITPSNPLVKGNPNAKVKIVEFSDFECPYCQRAANVFKSLLEKYKDDVAFYFVNYPLDKACNANMQRDLHKSACMAAYASVCAQEQNKFWDYHDLLFVNQGKFSDDNLKSYANQTGLDENKFNSCLSSAKTKSWIKSDIELGQKAGIQGTPAVFLNGRKLNGWNDPEVLETIIQEALSQ
jgi:protein-disulfide isomerase/uncharacterized membrane protein